VSLPISALTPPAGLPPGTFDPPNPPNPLDAPNAESGPQPYRGIMSEPLTASGAEDTRPRGRHSAER
jgi:hypothetical protein